DPPRIEPAYAARNRACLERAPLFEGQRLAQGLVLGAGEPRDVDPADPRLLAGLDDDGDRAPVGGGILTHVEPHGGRRIAVAAQPAEHGAVCALEALGIGRSSERQRGAAGKVGRIDPELAGPLEALEERTPRHVEAEPDAAGLVDRLDRDLVEDAE